MLYSSDLLLGMLHILGHEEVYLILQLLVGEVSREFLDILGATHRLKQGCLSWLKRYMVETEGWYAINKKNQSG